MRYEYLIGGGTDSLGRSESGEIEDEIDYFWRTAEWGIYVGGNTVWMITTVLLLQFPFPTFYVLGDASVTPSLSLCSSI